MASNKYKKRRIGFVILLLLLLLFRCCVLLGGRGALLAGRQQNQSSQQQTPNSFSLIHPDSSFDSFLFAYLHFLIFHFLKCFCIINI